MNCNRDTCMTTEICRCYALLSEDNPKKKQICFKIKNVVLSSKAQVIRVSTSASTPNLLHHLFNTSLI